MLLAVKADGVGVVLLAVVNVFLVGWTTAPRGGRLRARAVRQPTPATAR